MRDYAGRLGQIRAREYPHAKGYLDNAASPLYPSSIPLEMAKSLIETPLVNPHSHGPWASETSRRVDDVRQQVLRLLNASPDEFTVVFTSNATAGAKLVGECLYDSHYKVLDDSHTSLIGLRALASTYQVVEDIPAIEYENTVVSYPLQSNFNGQRYPSSWIQSIAAGGGLSLLDLAAYCATTMPDFSEIKPDFAIISFYKIFGLPDLGALVVKRSAGAFFRKRKYFGGGTVAALTAKENFMVRHKDLAASLEDGTLPFHNIITLGIAIREFSRIYGSFQAISLHTQEITSYCRDRLEKTQLCEILSPKNGGPVVTFTLKYGGYHDLDLVASEVGLQVRTGTLCNIGAFVKHSTFSEKEIINNHVAYGKTCNDAHDMLDGRHTGVIRVSIGPYTARSDIDMLVDCIEEYFNEPLSRESSEDSQFGVVTDLVIYPIKSCGGTRLSETTITAAGLKWDREFCLVEISTGKTLRLKKFPKMAHIRSTIDEKAGDLVVNFGPQSIRVPIEPNRWGRKNEDSAECCRQVADLVLNSDPEVVKFFSDAMGTSCTVAKAAPDERFAKETQEQTLANSSPLLFVSRSSSEALEIDYQVFRGNIIFDAPAFVEDSWPGITVAGKEYQFSAPCQRCNMICFTPQGQSDARPYLILTKHRKVNGKIYFGQLGALGYGQASAHVKLGDVVRPLI